MSFRHEQFVYAVLTTSVALLALGGYVGYLLYPRFDLPTATGIGLLVFAPAAGIASFFSPCSFPLLVTLLARESSYPTALPTKRVSRLLRFASALALGAAVFLLLVGSGIALGASTLFEGVTFTSAVGRAIRMVVGAFLILFGLIQLGILPARAFPAAYRMTACIRRGHRRVRRQYPTIGFGVYGFGYILAGFG